MFNINAVWLASPYNINQFKMNILSFSPDFRNITIEIEWGI